MKIGILTLPLHTNYGGILQAWALQTTLTQMGHEAKLVMRKTLSLLPWEKTIEDKALLNTYTYQFVDRYIQGDDIVDCSCVKEGDFDAFVVGSDQIWRYRYAKILIKSWQDVFLKFAENWDVRRVAYAASYGLDTWEAPQETIEEISRLAKKFDFIGVRESTGVDICNDYLGVEAKHVIDPTLLLQKEDYIKLIDNAENLKPLEGDMLNYVLNEDNEKTELVHAIESHFGLRSFKTNSRCEDMDAPREERIQPPLEQWLKSFRDCRFVITDSFHATVFSIQFHKPFIVTGNPARGMARLQSLLSSLGLEKHLVMNVSEFDPDFDYSVSDEAYERLGKMRKECRQMLQNALNLTRFPNCLIQQDKGAEMILNAPLRMGVPQMKEYHPDTRILLQENAKMIVDGKFSIFASSYIRVMPNAELILHGGFINENVQITCGNRIEIGSGCAIGRDVIIRDHDGHTIVGSPISKPITIGEHVWIGQRATILKGVNIGEGAIVASGAIVSRDVPPHGIVAGIPAKVIRENVEWQL